MKNEETHIPDGMDEKTPESDRGTGSRQAPDFGKYLWWEKGIIYQVYPRSMQDTNGDGVGDLVGITNRLDYLKWLGIDGVWISPVYQSPMKDFGYDVSNYRAIDPIFGTMEDFDRLIEKARSLDLHIIMDCVPNHSSDQHPWFLESRSSRDNPKRDWYLWHDPKPDGSPPNNWLSVFGGSGWEFDEKTGQYYFHSFLKEQPDLNWRNPEVKEAWEKIFQFWLDRGVDGFRVDVLWHLIKDDQLRDNPPNPNWNPETDPEYNKLDPVYSTDRPAVLPLVEHTRSVIDAYGPDKLFIGEIYLPTEKLMKYYGPESNGTNMPYNFQLALMPWDSQLVMRAVDYYEAHLPEGAWPNWVLGNHDQPRIASRIRPHQIRGAQLMLLTLRGTPTMYYGDELGMRDIEVPADRVQDPFEKRDPGKGNGRDPERSPMPWDGSKNGGFTNAEHAWLPIGSNVDCNVEKQKADPWSLLNMVKRLIELRKRHPALSVGGHQPIPASEPIAAFCRSFGPEHLYIIVNFSDKPQVYPISHGDIPCIFSTSRDRECPGNVGAEVALGPGEGVVLDMSLIMK